MSEHKTAWQAYCETPEICPDGRMQADDAEIARLRWMNARLVEIAQREADRSHESARRAVTAEARVRELEEALSTQLALLHRYRTETPLGHQPHMIANLADEAIAKLDEILEGREDG